MWKAGTVNQVYRYEELQQKNQQGRSRQNSTMKSSYHHPAVSSESSSSSSTNNRLRTNSNDIIKRYNNRRQNNADENKKPSVDVSFEKPKCLMLFGGKKNSTSYENDEDLLSLLGYCGSLNKTGRNGTGSDDTSTVISYSYQKPLIMRSVSFDDDFSSASSISTVNNYSNKIMGLPQDRLQYSSSRSSRNRTSTTSNHESSSSKRSKNGNTCGTSDKKKSSMKFPSILKRTEKLSSSQSESKKINVSGKRQWKTAVDPKTGRTYYYDAITLETQWRKPLELTTIEERENIQRKEKQQLNFFKAMERNILLNLQHGKLPGEAIEGQQSTHHQGQRRQSRGSLGEVPSYRSSTASSRNKSIRPKVPSTSLPPLRKPKHINVRTISTMGKNIEEELTKVIKSNKNQESHHESPNSVVTPSILSEQFIQTWVSSGAEHDQEVSQRGLQIDIDKSSLDNSVSWSFDSCSSISSDSTNSPSKKSTKQISKPNPISTRRNTCSTLYLNSTMSAPDVEATIKCVCAVYRAHLLQSVKDEKYSVTSDAYNVFNDYNDYYSRDSQNIKRYGPGEERFSRIQTLTREFSIETSLSDEEDSESCVPSLDEITFFYRYIFLKAQMEPDCIIMSLIYIEKLIKTTQGHLRPRLNNWRSLLFSSMILSSKVWDDLSMWNVDFTQVCPPNGVEFNLQRVNELELAMLNCFNFKVKVSASEYAKYYFLLRSMLIKSELGGDEFLASSPLDTKAVTEKFGLVGETDEKKAKSNNKSKRDSSLRRCKSTGDIPDLQNDLSVEDNSLHSSSHKIVLEKLVKM